MSRIQLAISVRKFSRILYTIIILLLLASAIAYFIRHFTDDYSVYGLGSYIDVASETSLATYFSCLNLLLASCLLVVVARYARVESLKLERYWLVLAWIFLYLSIDEATAIHENIGWLYEAAGEPLPVFDSHKWLPIGIVFSISVAAFFGPFLLKIPRALALRLIVAGAIFLTGAIGFEFIGALMFYTEFAERGDLIYELRRIGEEGCEMVGIAYLNITLMRELTNDQLVLTIERG